jgi:hypothetical protein
MQVDWIEHYKGVRSRLNSRPQPPAPKKEEGPQFPKIMTPRETLIDKYLKPILKEYDTTISELRQDRKFVRLHSARQEISVALSQHGWSTLKIGKFLNKDHSTIVHYLKRSRNDRSTQPADTIEDAEGECACTSAH